jgi:hypothetical protein
MLSLYNLAQRWRKDACLENQRHSLRRWLEREVVRLSQTGQKTHSYVMFLPPAQKSKMLKTDELPVVASGCTTASLAAPGFWGAGSSES